MDSYLIFIDFYVLDFYNCTWHVDKMNFIQYEAFLFCYAVFVDGDNIIHKIRH